MPSKDDIRKQLDDAYKAHLEQHPEAVTLYAAVPEPERRPWRKRPTPSDEAYQRALDQISKGAKDNA